MNFSLKNIFSFFTKTKIDTEVKAEPDISISNSEELAEAENKLKQIMEIDNPDDEPQAHALAKAINHYQKHNTLG
jgi:hypothetical protein